MASSHLLLTLVVLGGTGASACGPSVATPKEPTSSALGEGNASEVEAATALPSEPTPLSSEEWRTLVGRRAYLLKEQFPNLGYSFGLKKMFRKHVGSDEIYLFAPGIPCRPATLTWLSDEEAEGVVYTNTVRAGARAATRRFALRDNALFLETRSDSADSEKQSSTLIGAYSDLNGFRFRSRPVRVSVDYPQEAKLPVLQHEVLDINGNWTKRPPLPVDSLLPEMRSMSRPQIVERLRLRLGATELWLRTSRTFGISRTRDACAPEYGEPALDSPSARLMVRKVKHDGFDDLRERSAERPTSDQELEQFEKLYWAAESHAGSLGVGCCQAWTGFKLVMLSDEGDVLGRYTLDDACEMVGAHVLSDKGQATCKALVSSLSDLQFNEQFESQRAPTFREVAN